MQITVKVMDELGLLNHAQLDFFLKGNLSLEKGDRKNPYTWFSEAGWHDLMRLAVIGGEGANPALKEIPNDIERDESAWKAYYDLENLETSPLPNGFEERVSAFEKLLVLRCIKMDRVTVRSVGVEFDCPLIPQTHCCLTRVDHQSVLHMLYADCCHAFCYRAAWGEVCATTPSRLCKYFQAINMYDTCCFRSVSRSRSCL